jgi:hypothetical protein
MLYRIRHSTIGGIGRAIATYWNFFVWMAASTRASSFVQAVRGVSIQPTNARKQGSILPTDAGSARVACYSAEIAACSGILITLCILSRCVTFYKKTI